MEAGDRTLVVPVKSAVARSLKALRRPCLVAVAARFDSLPECLVGFIDGTHLGGLGGADRSDVGVGGVGGEQGSGGRGKGRSRRGEAALVGHTGGERGSL